MVDLDSITIEVNSIKDRGDVKIVDMETSYREGTSLNIMQRATRTRARARALISTGVVNTVVGNVRGDDIQRLTEVKTFKKLKSIGSVHKAKIVVEVKDKDGNTE